MCALKQQIKVHIICAVQQSFYCLPNMCGTADILMFTQYVWYSRQMNAHTICAVKQTGNAHIVCAIKQTL